VGRAAALQLIVDARERRSQVLAELGAGTLDLATVCDLAREDELVGMIRVLAVLEARPGTLKVPTRRKLAELGIDPLQPLVDCDARQLLKEFG
jgi:hypothetical protein